ncbi:MAG: hypothetical protein EKK51_28370 [Mycolicibacterium sp.]|uniref:acyl-CoA-like ligand-binding transcription factor n=1 Tax=Mycolicibacterium sp. TaxID=2320850 RepID=UPI000F95FCD9|nr:hypothetical protein [Mycolicibacterium sp.]RUP26998.1 MAG: hypothetical protein EKK51_28370 [Mycolicibacterium sp.]
MAIHALASQPADVSTLEACRRAVETTITSVSDDAWVFEQQRWRLVFSRPELKEMQYAAYRRVAQEAAEIECRRLGRNPGDLEIRTFFGALTGALVAALDDGHDLQNSLMWALEFIETGMIIPETAHPDDIAFIVRPASGHGLPDEPAS